MKSEPEARVSLRYLPTILSTLLILVAVMLPGSQIPPVDIIGIDKIAHFTLFTIWSTAIRHDFGGTFRWTWTLLVGVCFSVLTEVLQIVADERSPDVGDVVADVMGLLFGILLGGYFIGWISWIIGRLKS